VSRTCQIDMYEIPHSPDVEQAKFLQLANGGSAHVDHAETRAAKQTLHREVIHLSRDQDLRRLILVLGKLRRVQGRNQDHVEVVIDTTKTSGGRLGGEIFVTPPGIRRRYSSRQQCGKSCPRD
jgi:hypothetical protein